MDGLIVLLKEDNDGRTPNIVYLMTYLLDCSGKFIFIEIVNCFEYKYINIKT